MSSTLRAFTYARLSLLPAARRSSLAGKCVTFPIAVTLLAFITDSLTRMSSQPASVLDLEAIANLRALGDEGDDTFLREIITIYLEDVPQRIVDLKSARAANDKALYVRSAHTIKGSSANVGATEMRNLAEKMEHRAKIEPLPGLDPDLVELETAFVRTVTALRALLG